MRLASWNVNSINARLDAALTWLDEGRPDVLALQELKCMEDGFPRLEFEAKGFHVLVAGQKSYNGVALISRFPLEDPVIGLAGDASDKQARYVEATVAGVRVASIYLPNGNPIGTEKFTYKLAWMDRLRLRAAELLRSGQPVALMGDFNVIPTPEDCYDPSQWTDDALYQSETRAQFRALCWLGYYDAFRTVKPGAPAAYTFWDYQAGAWQKDNGIRIDHIMLSAGAIDRLEDVDIDRRPRGRIRPSDHTPIWCELADATPAPRL
jgi:exodeoxyribonuclease-3